MWDKKRLYYVVLGRVGGLDSNWTIKYIDGVLKQKPGSVDCIWYGRKMLARIIDIQLYVSVSFSKAF